MSPQQTSVIIDMTFYHTATYSLFSVHAVKSVDNRYKSVSVVISTHSLLARRLYLTDLKGIHTTVFLVDFQLLNAYTNIYQQLMLMPLKCFVLGLGFHQWLSVIDYWALSLVTLWFESKSARVSLRVVIWHDFWDIGQRKQVFHTTQCTLCLRILY